MKTGTITSQRQQQRSTPQQRLVSSMLLSTSDDLEQIIREEEQRNVALQVDERRECGEETDGNSDEGSDLGRPDDGDGMGPEGTQVGDDSPGGSDKAREADGDDDSEAPIASESSNNTDAPDEDRYDDNSLGAGQEGDDDEGFSPFDLATAEQTFRENLKQQLYEDETVSDEERYLAEYIIDSLDDSGYLTTSLDELADDLYFNQHHETTADDLEDVLVNVVQELEPAGIGARNLRECLMLQLQEKKATPANRLAYAIIEKDYDKFVGRRFDLIREDFGVTRQLLMDAYHVLERLSPKQGGTTSPASVVRSVRGSLTDVMSIRPEFTVHEENGELIVSVNDDNVPDVRVSVAAEANLEALQQKAHPTADDRAGIKMYREHINMSRMFIEALRQRHETMLKVMTAIVGQQREYFLTGERERLLPMVQREVAERAGVDISTVSRACDGKAIQTDFGIVRCSELFSATMQNADGDDVSAAAVKKALYDLIMAEDKAAPMSDETLSAQLLKQHNLVVARRTVAKYREQLGFPTAKMRRRTV